MASKATMAMGMWVGGTGVGRYGGEACGRWGRGGANYRFRRAGGPPIHDVLNGREAGGKTDGSETQGQWKRRDDSSCLATWVFVASFDMGQVLVFDLGTTGVERDCRMWKQQKTTTMREKGRGQLF